MNPAIRLVLVALLVNAPASIAVAEGASAVQRMQERRLFQPSDEELKDESAGSVYIYDGLPDKTVLRAMDKEFDRVDSMMFIRTIHTDDTGEALRNPGTGEIVADDDC